MAGQPPPPLFLPSPPFLRHHGTRLYSSGRGRWGRARHGVHGRRGSRRPAPADALRTAAGTGAGDLGDTDSVATPLTPRCGGGGGGGTGDTVAAAARAGVGVGGPPPVFRNISFFGLFTDLKCDFALVFLLFPEARHSQNQSI
jgi:hypothetical protein